MDSSIGAWLGVTHYSDPLPPELRLSAGSDSLPKGQTPNSCPNHSLFIFPLTTNMSLRPLLLYPLGSSYLFIILWQVFLDCSFSPQNSTPHLPIMKSSAPGLIKSSCTHLFWRSRSHLKTSSRGWSAAVMFEQAAQHWSCAQRLISWYGREMYFLSHLGQLHGFSFLHLPALEKLWSQGQRVDPFSPVYAQHDLLISVWNSNVTVEDVVYKLNYCSIKSWLCLMLALWPREHYSASEFRLLIYKMRKNTHTPVFTIARTRMKTRCPLTDEWKKRCGTNIQWNTTQPLKGMKLPFAATWINLEIITLTEESIQRQISYDITYSCHPI